MEQIAYTQYTRNNTHMIGKPITTARMSLNTFIVNRILLVICNLTMQSYEIYLKLPNFSPTFFKKSLLDGSSTATGINFIEINSGLVPAHLEPFWKMIKQKNLSPKMKIGLCNLL